MFTVALVGADGAGKTTIARRIQQESNLAMKYIYMGANADSSNVLLPTTRLVLLLKKARGQVKTRKEKRGEVDAPTQPRSRWKQVLYGAKSYLWVVNRMADEWFRQFVVWFHILRGRIVLYDRHFFFDYYAYDVAPQGLDRPLSRRIHGQMLKHIYPKPELVILLDAPAELLYTRKPEASLDYLERRRQEYLTIGEQMSNFNIVDASQPEDEVLQEVLQIIQDYQRAKMGKFSKENARISVERNETNGGESVA